MNFENIVQFAIEHWIVILLAVTVAAFFTFNIFSKSAGRDIKTVKVKGNNNTTNVNN